MLSGDPRRAARRASSSARCSAARTATRSSPRSCSLRAARARRGPRLPPTLREILLAHVAAVAGNRERRPARRRSRRASRRARVARRGRRPARGRTARRAPRRGRRATSWSSRPATASNAMRSATRSSRRSCTTTCCPASAATCIGPSPRRSRSEPRRAALPKRPLGRAGAPLGCRPAERPSVRQRSLRAAEAAMGSYAFGAALIEYERALDLWDDVDDPSGSCRLRPGRTAPKGRVRPRTCRPITGGPSRTARKPTAGSTRSTDPLRAGILREELGRGLWVLGDVTGALETYREAVAITPADRPTAERARALSGLGQILMLLDRYDESRRLCRGGDRGRPAGRCAGTGGSRPELLRA